MEQPLDCIEGLVRACRPKRLPVVLAVDEVSRVLARLTGDKWLIAILLYGGGLRLLECLRLRVKDLDFECSEITVREGKGDKDRMSANPHSSFVSMIHDCVRDSRDLTQKGQLADARRKIMETFMIVDGVYPGYPDPTPQWVEPLVNLCRTAFYKDLPKQQEAIENVDAIDRFIDSA